MRPPNHRPFKAAIATSHSGKERIFIGSVVCVDKNIIIAVHFFLLHNNNLYFRN